MKYVLLTESHCTLKTGGSIPHQSSILFWLHSHLHGNSFPRNVYLQHNKLLKFYSEHHFLSYTSKTERKLLLDSANMIACFFSLTYFTHFHSASKNVPDIFLSVYIHMNKEKINSDTLWKKTCPSYVTRLHLFLHFRKTTYSNWS